MDFSKADFSHPNNECDLVMKGGITSGIVYPPIVLKLASEGEQGNKYRFRNIGGTSAGAISAAVTAAAEYGRESGGFQRFEELRQQLSKPDFLFNLFQPTAALAPLMYTLLDLAGKTPPQKRVESSNPQGGLQAIFRFGEPLVERLPFGQTLNKVIDTLLRRSKKVYQKGYWGIGLGFGLAASFGIVATLIFQLTGGEVELRGFMALLLVLGIPLALVGYYLGILILGAIDIFESLTKTLPNDNLFGMCSGRSPTGRLAGMQSQEPVLTDWLSEQIDYISGLAEDRPLTFSDLQKKSIDGKNVSITLKTVTSNLSQNQPYTLPFEPGHLFLFSEKEFSQLFTEKVVRHLVEAGKKAGVTDRRKQYKLPANSGFYFLPDPDDLPIVVAMRMSLSFPLLISAVPLYTIKQSALTKSEELVVVEHSNLQKNWFSDGGICSNFPIHFFDSWLPLRPTFAINLATSDDIDKNADSLSPDNLSVSQNTSQPSQSDARAIAMQVQQQKRKKVYIWKAGDPDPAPEQISTKDKNAESLLKFIAQIFYTAQNYRDMMQSYLPGYRERIVQIRLNTDEGGLNLGMSQETITGVMKKGEQAGDLLNNLNNEGFNFEHHRWIRFRVLMGLLEENLKNTYESALKAVDPNDPSQGDIFGTDRLIEAAQANSYPYAYPPKDSNGDSKNDYAEKAKMCAKRMRLSVENVWNPIDQETKEPKTPSLADNQPEPKSILRTTPEI